MSHYITNYTGLAPEAREAKMITDIKEYLGEQKFNRLTRQLKMCRPLPTMGQLMMGCMVLGIEGAPIEAWARHIGIEVPNV